jgi:hypothetical protein
VRPPACHKGWKILHIDVPMTQHDLAVRSFKAHTWRCYRLALPMPKWPIGCRSIPRRCLVAARGPPRLWRSVLMLRQFASVGAGLAAPRLRVWCLVWCGDGASSTALPDRAAGSVILALQHALHPICRKNNVSLRPVPMRPRPKAESGLGRLRVRPWSKHFVLLAVVCAKRILRQVDGAVEFCAPARSVKPHRCTPPM